MNFDNIIFVKFGKHINVYNKKMEKIYFLEQLSTVFGNEHSNSVNYINWTLSEDLLETLVDIETGMHAHMKETYEIKDDWTWCPSVRHLQDLHCLRTTNSSDTQVVKNKEYTIKITLDRIWLHKPTKTYGIMWLC